MPIDFFEKEVIKAQEKFNQTFGRLMVCDLMLRWETILVIAFMGALGKQITQANNRDEVKEQIKKFMRIKMVLNNLFAKIEQHQKERRNNVNRNTQSGSSNGGNAGRRRSRNLSGVR